MTEEEQIVEAAVALVQFWATPIDHDYYLTKVELEMDLATAVHAYRLVP